MNPHSLLLPEYTKLEVAIINLDTGCNSCISILNLSVDNHKDGSFYNEMRECVYVSHMTQPGATTSIPCPPVLPTILPNSFFYYAITSPSNYIPFLYIPSIPITQDQIQIPPWYSIYNRNEKKASYLVLYIPNLITNNPH